ncbi:hypothetical protein [Agrococcus sp. Marseille-P2731]|uniref:hypothetical protein n=1 Tax=Agrococcus sp. Marseille-P2731 TaxID=1841862 RepID=UPI000931B972|nr:hypothetical protein [Agrococcus sp. Marseille-P2731]
MSALEAAAELREPVDHFDQLAQLERAALGAHAGEPLAHCDRAHAESLRLRAARPMAERATGLLGRLRAGRAAREHEARMEAWDVEVDALEAETEADMGRWRALSEPALIAAATADRDAAIRSLVERGLFDADLGEAMCAEPLGTMLVRSALAHD